LETKSDTALYAKWRAKVTFNPNGGNIIKDDTIVDLTEDVSGWAHIPTRTGYTFDGLNNIIITSPPSNYTKVSDTEYSVLYGDDFSFRFECDYPYTVGTLTVTVNGVRIYPDANGIYTVKV
jgi:hypothetical protein